MKRLFSMFTALIMCLCLASCGETKEVPIPEGYQVYDNGTISFAYPEGWTKQDGSTVILTDSEGSGNNITVVYENKNDMYASMDVEGFNTQLKPALEAMGMSVSNVTVTQTKNAGGVAITKLSYSASYMGVSMSQNLYITTVKDKTYTITVTEAKSDVKLRNNVFDTIKIVK